MDVCEVFHSLLELGWLVRFHLIGKGKGWFLLLEFAEFFGGEEGFMVGLLFDSAVIVAKVSDPLVTIVF